MKTRQPRKWPAANRKRFKNHLYINQGKACRDCTRYQPIDALRFRAVEDNWYHLVCRGGCK